MNKLWQWVLIMLMVTGAASAVVIGVLLLFSFAGFYHLKEYCSERLGLF